MGPDTIRYHKLQLWDSNGTVGGGRFVVNGAAQTGHHAIDVTPANVASTVFDVGTLGGGTDTLYARLVENDGSLSDWQSFGVTVPLPTVHVGPERARDQRAPNFRPNRYYKLRSRHGHHLIQQGELCRH